MNKGERNELIVKLKLIEIRDKKISLKLNNGILFVKSVGFDTEYQTLSSNSSLNNLKNLSDAQLTIVAEKHGISKAPGKSKADVVINGKGYSLKSLQAAPPAIVNHTPRTGFEVACQLSKIQIDNLDAIVSEYWSLRKKGIIKEDIHNDSSNSPFRNHKKYLKGILNYFLFKGTGSGLSNHPADFILDFSDPVNPATWEVYDMENAVDVMWNKMVFSLRSKGMPDGYPNVDRNKILSIKQWTEEFQGKHRGSLHIRTKK